MGLIQTYFFSLGVRVSSLNIFKFAQMEANN